MFVAKKVLVIDIDARFLMLLVAASYEYSVAEYCEVRASVRVGCSPFHMQHRLLHFADLSSTVLQTHLTV